jgi:hypothetical protein
MNWVSYFENNRAARRPIEWSRGINIDPAVRGAFARSLQRFQIGESGEGLHMKRCAAATGDAEYARAVHLFIAEEQAHAEMMAGILDRIGAPLIRRHWTDLGFVAVRRLMGLNLEVMVMLCAEIIGKNYFQALYVGIDDAVVRSVFSQIVRDEDGHVAFQCDRLRRSFEGLPGFVMTVLRGIWWALYQAAFLIVIYDHRHVLRALSISPGEFMRDCDRTFDEASAVIFGGMPVLIGRLPAVDQGTGR